MKKWAPYVMVLVLSALVLVIWKKNVTDAEVAGVQEGEGGSTVSIRGAADGEGQESRAKRLFRRGARGAERMITTESGLKYEVLEEGSGDSPGPLATVLVHYEGRFEDGEVFDSSYERGSAASFPLRAVIKGWTEGLQLMKPGAKFRFVIPPELAYGENGAGGSIPPSSTLIFEVELLEVKGE